MEALAYIAVGGMAALLLLFLLTICMPQEPLTYTFVHGINCPMCGNEITEDTAVVMIAGSSSFMGPVCGPCDDKI